MKIKILSMIVLFFIISSSIATSIYNISESNNHQECYGFIIPINSSQNNYMQINISQYLNELLRNNATIYWIASDISIKSKQIASDDSPKIDYFQRGSYIITFSGDSLRDAMNTNIVYSYHIDKNVKTYKILEPIENIRTYILTEPKIAYNVGSNIYYESYLEILSESGFKNHDFLDWGDISKKLNNQDFNVFIWGGGNTDLISVAKGQLRIRDISALRKFVANGGGYVGSCYGGSETVTRLKFPFNWLKVYFPRLHSLFLPSFSNRFSTRALPGYGSIFVRIVDTDNPVSYGLPELIKSYYMGGPLFIGKEGKTKTFGEIAGIYEENYDYQNFMMPPFDIPDKIIDKWVNFSIDKPLWTTTDFGEGRVVAFGDHPEHFGIRFMNDSCPVRIIQNAVFYSCSEGPFELNVDKKITFSGINAITNGPYESKISQQTNLIGELVNSTSSCSTIWSFGDGQYSFNLNTNHTYKRAKNYTLVLAAFDEEGRADIDITNCFVPEKLNVIIQPYNINNNTELNFTADIIGGFPPYSYYWDFGDENTSQNCNPSNIYQKTGVYTGNITVFDKYNEKTSSELIVVVNDKNNPFEIILSSNLDKTYIENEIKFKINVTTKNDYFYNISFGDGEIFKTYELDSAVYSINHSYSELGFYYVIATVNDSEGYRYSNVVFITIDNLGPPEKPIITGPKEVKTGELIEFNFKTKDPDNDKFWYKMDFFTGKIYGDSNYLYDSNETFMWVTIIKRTGEHKIRVKAVDENGYESEWSDTFYITAYEKNRITNILKDIIIKK